MLQCGRVFPHDNAQDGVHLAQDMTKEGRRSVRHGRCNEIATPNTNKRAIVAAVCAIRCATGGVHHMMSSTSEQTNSTIHHMLGPSGHLQACVWSSKQLMLPGGGLEVVVAFTLLFVRPMFCRRLVT